MNLYQRTTDGYALKDGLINRDYPKIPDATCFQSSNGFGMEVPVRVVGWQWSTTFNRWSALVIFSNGWRGFTWAIEKNSE